jgi:hypothetical protein
VRCATDLAVADDPPRHALPIPAGDHKLPWVLLTKSNIGTPEDSYDRPADYAQQFEQLRQAG